MNAALSLAGIIPIVGDSLKVFRYADEAADAAGMLRRAPDVYGSVRHVDNSAWAARGTVRYGDDVAPAARRADCNSFVPGTRVVLADGSAVPIEDVEVGDEVLATSDGAGERGDSGSFEVTATISSVGDKDLVEIALADGSSITATSGHPVWVADGAGGGAWVDAADVRAGDALVDADGAELAVASVAHRGERTEVHNLTVEGVHTYYALAGDTPVWVHNSVCDLADDGGNVAGRKAGGDRGAPALSPEHRALALQNITDSGDAVLGRYRGYIDKAQSRGASYFDIGDEWNRLEAQGIDPWDLNVEFLETIAARGDRVLLSVPMTEIPAKGYLRDEVNYLVDKLDYAWVNQWSLRPRG